MGDVGIGADKTLLGCTDDVESCCLGLLFPCAVYGQNRKRIGTQGCCSGILVLLVPLVALAVVARLITSGIVESWEVCEDLHHDAVVKRCNVSGVVSVENCDVCPVPKDCESYVDSDDCSVPFPTSVYTYGWGIGVVMAAYSVLLLAQNRSLLQRTLGMRDEGLVNYLVYLVLPLCALCQEARAVRSRTAQLEVQMPMAPGRKGKAHRLDFERQEEPDPEGLSFFMFASIIAMFVGYWYAVIALYFYGSLNSSTAMVRPDQTSPPHHSRNRLLMSLPSVRTRGLLCLLTSCFNHHRYLCICR
jgi:Cys-rich protein (TIGR01571 family)